MRILLTLIFILLTSCGGEVKLKAEAPDEAILSGETYSYVIVQLDFIQQMRQICEDLYLESEFDTQDLYLQEVAQCTLDNLSILDLSAVEEFNDEICNNPDSLEEQQICDAIN